MCKYVVVDLEMCNVRKACRKEYTYGKEIIQIGAVLLDENYNVESTFDTYVQPVYGCLDNFIRNLTGIQDLDLIDAPLFHQAVTQFIDWIPNEDVKVVSWSMSDPIQLRKEGELKNIEVPCLEAMCETWIDAQALFSDRIKSEKIYKLTEALIATDVNAQEIEHNAMADAENTAVLFGKMQKESKLILNDYYGRMLQNEQSTLGFSMGSILAGIQGSCFATA